MVKVFFGCSMRGGYNIIDKTELAKIPDIIEELGYEIASRHQTQDWKKTEAKLTNTNIHDRDYNWEIISDCGIFEISNPSLGVGGEISDMITLGKPILCLFKKGLEEEISAYTQGKKGSKYVKTPFECQSYESLEDIKKIIQNFMNIYF
ncbi:MAG: hypothetical protein PHF86_08145 [Candidatus Nanoarchaeia archaeon]|nr:hypothetical protein [Candidatus Nanoarchaeia archaeon]